MDVQAWQEYIRAVLQKRLLCLEKDIQNYLKTMKIFLYWINSKVRSVSGDKLPDVSLVAKSSGQLLPLLSRNKHCGGLAWSFVDKSPPWLSLIPAFTAPWYLGWSNTKSMMETTALEIILNMCSDYFVCHNHGS